MAAVAPAVDVEIKVPAKRETGQHRLRDTWRNLALLVTTFGARLPDPERLADDVDWTDPKAMALTHGGVGMP